MRAVLNVILKVFEILLVCCIAVLTVVTIAQVTMRYVFSSPFIWAEELCRYLMIWAIMLGSTIFVDGSRHVRVRFFVDLLPEKPRKFVLILVEGLILALSLMIVFQGFQYAAQLKDVVTPALGISKFAVVVSIPACTVIWCLCGANNIISLIRSRAPDKASGNA